MTERYVSERVGIEMTEIMSIAVAAEMALGVLDVEMALRDATRDAAFGISAGFIYTRLAALPPHDTPRGDG